MRIRSPHDSRLLRKRHAFNRSHTTTTTSRTTHPLRPLRPAFTHANMHHRDSTCDHHGRKEDNAATVSRILSRAFFFPEAVVGAGS